MNGEMRPHLDYALGYARRGLRIFPLHELVCGDCTCGRDDCSSAGKHPRTKNGVKDATRDCEQITNWWTHWPTANIGIATGDGLYVIDVDCAKGATMASLEELSITGCMWTLTARTGSGGYHLYLQTTQALANTAGKLAPFVDTRGEGGYVVAPPSFNKHGRYSWYNSLPMQQVPEEVLVRLRGPVSPTRSTRENQAQHTQDGLQQQDKESNGQGKTARTDRAITRNASAEVDKEARNTFLVGMAGTLRGQGLSAHEICALLLALNETRYGQGRHPQGPLEREELERTIFKSVVRWQEEGGIRASNVPVVELLTDLMQRELPEPFWLVPKLLCEGLVLFAGKAKMGKSWMALSLALSCALANQEKERFLARYPVNHGGVLYLSLEDGLARFQDRVNKLLAGRPIPTSFGYALQWKPLMSGGVTDLETVLASTPDTRLVVIDTLACLRAAGGKSSNIYQEDYKLMGDLRSLATRYHATVLLVHHTRKEQSTDAFDEISGSTGLTGAADTSIVLKRERGQGEARMFLTGRDIEEQELALSFNPTTLTWAANGTVAEHQNSQSRKEVIDLFQQNGSMTPAQLARNLEKSQSTIRGLLRRMTQDGLLVKFDGGHYGLSALAVSQQDAGEEA